MYMPSIRTLVQMTSRHKCADTHSSLQTPLPHAKSFSIAQWRVKRTPPFSPEQHVTAWDGTGRKKVRIDSTCLWLTENKKVHPKKIPPPPPPETEETVTLGQRGTLHYHFHLTQCLHQSVCLKWRQSYIFFVWSNIQRTHKHTHILSPVFTMEHVFSGWHMYMQSVSWTCTGETEGNGSDGRKR